MKKFIKSILLFVKSMLGLELRVRKQIKVSTKTLGDLSASWTIHPDGIDENSIIYSFGIGENISFDLELIQAFDCQVHAFDPTPKSIDWLKKQDLPSKLYTYHYGIADHDGFVSFHAPKNKEHVSHTLLDRKLNTDQIQVEVKKLATILKELGHHKIDILKMDIEGAEYAVIENIIEEGIEISQILVEFHHRFKEIGLKTSKNAVEKLIANGYKLFSISSSKEEYSFIKT